MFPLVCLPFFGKEAPEQRTCLAWRERGVSVESHVTLGGRQVGLSWLRVRNGDGEVPRTSSFSGSEQEPRVGLKILMRGAGKEEAWACCAAYAPSWNNPRPSGTLGTLSSSNKTGRCSGGRNTDLVRRLDLSRVDSSEGCGRPGAIESAQSVGRSAQRDSAWLSYVVGFSEEVEHRFRRKLNTGFGKLNPISVIVNARR